MFDVTIVPIWLQRVSQTSHLFLSSALMCSRLRVGEVAFHEVADLLAAGHRVGVRRHTAGAALVEQAHQGAEDLRRLTEARIGRGSGVGGGARGLQIGDGRLRGVTPVADPHEHRCPLRAELLRHDVIERAADRLGVELCRVEADGSVQLGVTGCNVKYDPARFRWGSFACAPAAARPML